MVLVWWVLCGWREILRASQLSALCSLLAGVASGVGKLVAHPFPTKLWGTLGGGLTRGWDSPEDQPGPHSHPGLSPGPAVFSCCARTRSKCCFLFLPEAKLLLYFLELLIVNLRVLREAKYIPLVNEEIKLFKSCPGGSHSKAAWRGGGGGHEVWSHLYSIHIDTRALGLAHRIRETRSQGCSVFESSSGAQLRAGVSQAMPAAVDPLPPAWKVEP